jgi:fibronectin-binding autotransporter adhesin
MAAAAVAGLASAAGARPASATANPTLYWDPGATGTGTWTTSTSTVDWASTIASGSPTAFWTNGSAAFFSNGAVTASPYNVSLGTSIVSAGIEFNTSSAVNVSAGAFTINNGTSALTMDFGAGAVDIASTLSIGGSANFGTGTIVNNSASTLQLGTITTNGFVSTASFNGTGNIIVNGAIGGGSGATEFGIVDNDTGVLNFTTATGNYGQVTINAGTLVANTGGAFGTGSTNLGNGSGGSVSATLELKGTSGVAYANSITLGSTTGTLLLYVPSFNSATVNGAISGTNNLSVGIGPNGAYVYLAGGVNNTGYLTFIQEGSAANNTGNIYVNSAIGSHVTGVTNNTGPFGTTLSSASNAYTGFTNVSSGYLYNGVNNALPTSLPLNVTGGNYLLEGYNQSVGVFNTSAGAVVGNNSSTGASILTVTNGGTSAGLIKDGLTKTLALNVSGGTLSLSGASNYSGGTTIHGGTVLIGASSVGTTSGALGTGAVNISTSGTASLLTNGPYTFSTPVGLVAGSGSATATVGGNADASSAFSGAITLGLGNATFSQVATTAGHALSLTGGISINNVNTTSTATFAGPGTINVSGGAIANGGSGDVLNVTVTGGTLVMAAPNTYTGSTTINGGTVLAGASSSANGSSGPLGNSAGTVTLFASGAGALLTNGAFTVANPITAGPSGTSQIGGNADATSTFSGAISLFGNATFTQVANAGANMLNLTGGISTVANATATFAGPGTINVSGGAVANGGAGLAVSVTGGKVIFAAAGSYSGGTTVTGGTLRAENAAGSLGSGAVGISGTGTLAGSGTTGSGTVTVAGGGTITAGSGMTTSDTVGALTTGPLTLGGGTYDVKLNLAAATSASPTTGGSGGGTTSDELVITGLVSASSTPGLSITPVPLSNPASGPTYSFVIADAQGSQNAGVFDPLITGGQVALTATSDANGDTFGLSTMADATGGEDLLLDVTAATPEPTSLLLAGAAIAPLALRRRRRIWAF